MKPFDLVLGAGTKIVRERATIVLINAPSKTPPRVRWWLIQQTIHLSCRVVTPTDHDCKCARCGTTMPDPDASTAEYLLENQEDGRLVFPGAADNLRRHPRRDSYPVDGWVSLFGSVICSTCNDAFTNFMQRKTP